jgi:hypothetical protein
MRKSIVIIGVFLLVTLSCEQVIPEYPDEPVVEYQSFSFFVSVDQLGNKTLVGRLAFEFTDGDGNLGLPELPQNTDPDLPDTVKYNFFLQLYDLQEFEYVKIPAEDGGVLKYRIPVLDKKPTKGLMELDISYPIIVHDTIFYTFYVYDQDLNRSNTDSTDVQVLSGIDLTEF